AGVEVSETLRLSGRTLVREVQVSDHPTRRSEFTLPPAKPAPAGKENLVADPRRVEGSLERPRYRAVAYPPLKTRSGQGPGRPRRAGGTPAGGPRCRPPPQAG